jgi:DNA-binding winged helix-turn-helix (wHTH) protein/TolB-like protein
VSRQFRFGQFVFDGDSGALTREGVRRRLQPQPARVLALLLERAGELVSREELRQQIWGQETFVDFERGLNFCIAQVRSVLGDSSDAPRYLETLPRRGYRFIAPVAASPPAPPAVADTPPTGLDKRLSHRLFVVAGAAALMLAFSLFVILRPSPAGPTRIAVVPFDDETAGRQLADVAGGVADATVARLATPERLRRFEVVGNAAALRRPREFRDLKEIGREVGAEYVVLAQLKSDAEGVRLIAHLIRVADESHLWASTFDRPAFTLEAQAEIAEQIAAAVTARLSGAG